ncbi:hypothetical protein B0H10DRAFT_2095196 [Mycena sp. CBHHK59/15]|nr:hypothetical protein B0H10DRAFT_2095196 [Mycena sp. CBHHK59/15]
MQLPLSLLLLLPLAPVWAASSSSASTTRSAAASSGSLSPSTVSSAALPSLSGVPACITNCLAVAASAAGCDSEAAVNCFCVTCVFSLLSSPSCCPLSLHLCFHPPLHVILLPPRANTILAAPKTTPRPSYRASPRARTRSPLPRRSSSSSAPPRARQRRSPSRRSRHRPPLPRARCRTRGPLWRRRPHLQAPAAVPVRPPRQLAVLRRPIPGRRSWPACWACCLLRSWGSSRCPMSCMYSISPSPPRI